MKKNRVIFRFTKSIFYKKVSIFRIFNFSSFKLYRKLHTILLITIIVPNVVFASFSSSFNNLLNRFFGNRSANTDSSSVGMLRDFPEIENLAGFRSEIQKEENTLENIENKLDNYQKELFKVINEKNTAQSQLDFLDEDINLSQQKLSTLQESKKKWKQKLEEITRKKSVMEAEIRVIKKELEGFLNKNFIQNEGLGSADEVSLFRWLFSRKTVSQILEDRMREANYEKDKKNKLVQLGFLQKKITLEEKNIAKIFQRVSELSQSEADQKSLLKKLADAKAQVVSRNKMSQSEIESVIAQARQSQAESTVILQNLRIGMKEFQELSPEFQETKQQENEEIKKEEKKILDFPLKIPRKITAEFLSEEYKETMNKDHYGVDFRAPQGTEIFAPAEGLIKKVAQNGYNYSYLIIDHGNDLFTVYGHVSDIFVREGEIVTAGEKIGLTGGTPGMPGSGYFTTGPHLHFEVFKDGRYVNPVEYLKD